MNSNETMFKGYLSSPQSLIAFMEHSQDHWSIKDNHSQYIYTNSAALNGFNIPKNFDMEGKLDKEVPVAWSELWPELIEHDCRVMDENRKISSIEIHYYGKGNTDNLIPHLTDKMPLYDEKNDIIGVICHGKIIDCPTLLLYMHRLNRKTIQFNAPNDLFTKGEMDIIFWAMQRLSSKEIAKRLDLSPRTIETRLQFIYAKAGVHSKNQLMEYCKHTGLDGYIPADFVRKGLQFIQ